MLCPKKLFGIKSRWDMDVNAIIETSNRSLWRYYPYYALFIMMLVSLINQMDRFVLGIASQSLSQELEIGDHRCYVNQTWAAESECHKNCTALNKTECRGDDTCEWEYSGTGIRYQVLAGPAFIVLFAVSSLPMGVLASLPAVRRTLVLAVCLFLWSAMTLLSGFTRAFWELLLTRIGLGIFESACVPFASGIISDYFSKNSRGIAFSFFSLGVYVGYSLAFAFNFIVENSSWQWAFRIAGMPGLVVSIVLVLTVKEPVRQQSDEHKEKKYYSYKFLLKRIICSYFQFPLVILCVAAGLRQGGGIVWAYNAKSFFRELHCDANGVGTYLSWIPVVGGGIGVLVGGFLSDRLAKRWGYKARIVILVLSCLLSSPFVFGTLYLRPPWAFFSLLVSYILGEMWFGVCIAVAIDMVPPDVGANAVALFFFIVNLIGGNLNLALPSLEAAVGLRSAMIILFPCMYVAASILFVIAGIIWICSKSKARSATVLDTPETEGLIQPPDEDFSHSLTESQEIQRRMSKRKSFHKGAVDTSLNSLEKSIVLTASI